MQAEAIASALDSAATEAPAEPQEPLWRDLSDQGNALAVLDRYGAHIAFTRARGFACWDGRRWRFDAHGQVEFIAETLSVRRHQFLEQNPKEKTVPSRLDTSRANVSNAMFFVEARSEVDNDVFDHEPHLLNVGNGIVDLRTGDIKPHAPSAYLTHLVPVNLKPGADTTEWRRFINGALKGPEDDAELIPARAAFLQRWFGYSLTTLTSEEKLLYLAGPSRSGKGTLVDSIRDVLGKDIAVDVGFDTLTQKRSGDCQNHDLATFQHVRTIVASESDRSGRLSESLIKRITGGSAIFCALKRRDHFSFLPKFKITLTSNYPPALDPDDEAAWRRFEFECFPNSHVNNPDTTLKARFKTEEQKEAILAWMVQGAREFFEEGLGSSPMTSMLRSNFVGGIDFVQHWLDEKTTDDWQPKFDESRDSFPFVTNAELRKCYVKWCLDNGCVPLGPKFLSDTLAKKGYPRHRRANTRGHLKIVLREEQPHPELTGRN